MPFVNVLITRDGVTREQKAQVIAEITETLQRVLNKRPEQTHIVIDEVDTDNWGHAGETQTVIRARARGESKT
ncbi:4-oxalocrotonate tautomerase family protein [Burkholderiaceae bacterium UC74_6]